MERLSSCYFCGAPPDQPLATYRVADQLAASPAGRTVTLCPACHRKLDALLEETGTGALESDHPAGQSNLADDGQTTDRDDATLDRDPRATGRDDATPDREGSSDTLDPDRNAGSRSSVDSRARSDADRTADDGPDISSENSNAGDQPRTDEQTGAGGQSGEEHRTDAERAQGSDAGGDGPGSAARGQRDPSVSKQEYRKVLRLLQNREERVERNELEELATSAYGLTPAECAKILDVAIERGHVEQRGTELVLLD
jgi:hypothetical protein